MLKGKIDSSSGRKNIYGYLLDTDKSESRNCTLSIDNGAHRIVCKCDNDIFTNYTQNKFGHGYHGFRTAVPDALKDGKEHVVELIDEETGSVVDTKSLVFRKDKELESVKSVINSVKKKEVSKPYTSYSTDLTNIPDGVNIAYILDDKYVIPTCVSAISAISNKHSSSVYNFFFITNEISEHCASLLNSLSSSTVNVYIVQTELKELKDLHVFSSRSYCVATESALLKFKLPSYLSTLSKVLYLDGDIIIRTDLSELFSTDVSDYYLAAVEDSGTLYSQNPIVLKYERYFNSGVMLLNLDLLRKENKQQVLIETKKNSNDSTLMDQNVFNEVLQSKVKYLSIKYNCLFVNLIRACQKFEMEALNKKYNEQFSSLPELAEKALLVHYSSKDKPWKFSNTPLAGEWYSYYLKMCLELGLPKDSIKRECSLLSKNDTVYIEPDRPRIIVSMTTFPARIGIVHIPLQEILSQSVRPDKVLLWLAEPQFPNREKDLPDELLKLQEKGVTICWAKEDIKAHKKYFYTMQKYPHDLVITVDDDLHYSHYMIERLLDSYKRNPHCVSASRVHLMLANSGEDSSRTIRPYKTWKHEYDKWVNQPSMQLFPTCGAGTLFPPYSLRKETFNIEKIKRECLDADDVWLKMNMVLSGTSVVLCDVRQRLRYVENSQDVALWKTNVIEGNNDVQINTLISNSDHADTIISKIFEYAPYPNKEAKQQAKTSRAKK